MLTNSFLNSKEPCCWIKFILEIAPFIVLPSLLSAVWINYFSRSGAVIEKILLGSNLCISFFEYVTCRVMLEFRTNMFKIGVAKLTNNIWRRYLTNWIIIIWFLIYLLCFIDSVIAVIVSLTWKFNKFCWFDYTYSTSSNSYHSVL